MTSTKKFIYGAMVVALTSSALVSAQVSPTQILVTSTRTSIAPVVSSVGETSATVSIAPALLGGAVSDAEKQLGYFEYGETHQVCIMIYPTPEYCLPKKTLVGSTTVTITNLKPNTSYTVTYKRDNTIRCITTPCPDNGFETPGTEFTTTASGTVATPSTPAVPSSPGFLRSLWLGSRGADVTALQNILIAEGHLKVKATGYYGALTAKAVKDYQKSHGIASLGMVGPLTRAHLNKSAVKPVTETFEGTITAFSTACFADGICSITVDGKTVVTTRGWSHDTVGKVTGIPDFGSIEQKVGAHAKVYAAKTEDGYTLYGSEDYYVDVK